MSKTFYLVSFSLLHNFARFEIVIEENLILAKTSRHFLLSEPQFFVPDYDNFLCLYKGKLITIRKNLNTCLLSTLLLNRGKMYMLNS